MIRAKERLLSAMLREGITWPMVQYRIERDEQVHPDIALSLVREARDGDDMKLVVAAAIITLISDKKHGKLS